MCDGVSNAKLPARSPLLGKRGHGSSFFSRTVQASLNSLAREAGADFLTRTTARPCAFILVPGVPLLR